MPLYPERVAEQLEANKAEIHRFSHDDTRVVEVYRERLRDAVTESQAEVRDAVGDDRDSYPGALPTREWDAMSGPIVPFDTSVPWDNHEAVNEFAAGALAGVSTVAADGSEIGPTREFTVPLGLVQTAWCRNGHSPSRDYEEDITTRLLVPDDLTEDRDDGRRYVDGQAPAHERYREEARTIIGCIERFADMTPPPVVLYDGPLVPSFANTFTPDIRDTYYRESMSMVLAASEHHSVPVVGYTAGSGSTNLAKLLRRRYPDTLGDRPFVADSRILDPFIDHWGDRSQLFNNRQDGAVDAMTTQYHGEEYEFWDDMLFAYLNIPGGDALDRVELPGWVLREERAEYVFDVVRAEAGVGRGYPEILQQADANAVLDTGAKNRFLALVQEFADEHDLPIEWDAKALSKERRRR